MEKWERTESEESERRERERERETQSSRENRLQTVKSFMQSIRSHEIIGAAGENNNHRPKSIKKITSLPTVDRSPFNLNATGAPRRSAVNIYPATRARTGWEEHTHTHTEREIESEIGGLVLAPARQHPSFCSPPLSKNVASPAVAFALSRSPL